MCVEELSGGGGGGPGTSATRRRAGRARASTTPPWRRAAPRRRAAATVPAINQKSYVKLLRIINKVLPFFRVALLSVKYNKQTEEESVVEAEHVWAAAGAERADEDATESTLAPL